MKGGVLLQTSLVIRSFQMNYEGRRHRRFAGLRGSDVFGVAEDDGGSGSREAGFAVGNFGRGELQRITRARSRAEFVAKIGDCLKELDETAYWLELLSESGVLQPTKLFGLSDECDQLIAILTTISKKTKAGL